MKLSLWSQGKLPSLRKEYNVENLLWQIPDDVISVISVGVCQQQILKGKLVFNCGHGKTQAFTGQGTRVREAKSRHFRWTTMGPTGLINSEDAGDMSQPLSESADFVPVSSSTNK